MWLHFYLTIIPVSLTLLSCGSYQKYPNIILCNSFLNFLINFQVLNCLCVTYNIVLLIILHLLSETLANNSHSNTVLFPF
jgi:hypothetical protein